MSGRARHLRDGEWITNRKTDRRNPRTKPEDRPELRFTFILPSVLAFSTAAGDYGFATVDPDAMVTVRGKDREFVLRKAGEFLRSIADGHTLEPISAKLFCPSYPAPTLGAPARPGYTDSYQIVVTASPAVTITCGGLEPMVIQ
jgi:hypothetical protein